MGNIHQMDEGLHEGVIESLPGGSFGRGSVRIIHPDLDLIYHISGDLWCQDSEVVGEEYEQESEQEPSSVFSEIDVQRAQVLHPARRYMKTDTSVGTGC